MLLDQTGRTLVLSLAISVQLALLSTNEPLDAESLHPTPMTLKVGIESVDITPRIQANHPVWLAGYGWGRRATGIHDPLRATSVVFHEGSKKIAWVTVDVVGLQLPTVKQIRKRLPEFDYVLVSSTHNHEGPDTIGLWGKSPFHRGVDEPYLESLVNKIVTATQAASAKAVPVTAKFGTATDPNLVGDSRKPEVKAATLRILKFSEQSNPRQNVGIIVVWNCHPEALGSKNTMITADFPATTIKVLEQTYKCPIAYFSGEVGGLMAPPANGISDEKGLPLQRGNFLYAKQYGKAVANLAMRAVQAAEPIQLTPLRISQQSVAIPLQNQLYQTARLVGVLQRPGVSWTGDFNEVDQPLGQFPIKKTLAIATEVACLRLGDLKVACIPGEIYPELVNGQYQSPVEPNVDFPQAALEPALEPMMGSSPWMLIGLANDEIGYIVPKRQWDQLAPYAYGRKQSQYGEINSCGPEVAPIIMQALQQRIDDLEN